MTPDRRLLAALIIAAGPGFLAGCGESASARSDPPPPPTVGVIEPRQDVVPEWRVFTGRLEAVERVEVRARVTGFVHTVHFEEGALVDEGDVLYTLDPRTFVAERDAARARADEAEARLELARSEAERVTGLIDTRAVSRARSSTSGRARWTPPPRASPRPAPRSRAPSWRSSSRGWSRRCRAGWAGPWSPRATSSAGAAATRPC